ncbi:mechanosensitive ion channel family protein [Salinicola sp. LHM]|jgi:small-conductance mechanosensitive channel|uniref:mechanosensitive ion channel family protein n=1 Tax=unclassified Salinicola TaxID=2634022 RepID=UPI0008DE51E7|nr:MULTISPECIES: mechanosensitive ion channel family protein [unclassified Salinicola]OHZ04951.1 mechanosensitive ion channel protein MscS [Salinicola sp. MIT1003]WQH32302.1 mechanosensitive ion channel family protein [Salinicola sp. LHM]
MKSMNSWRRWLLAATIGLVSSLCLAQAQEEGGEKDWYPLDSLNTGLGQAPESVSLRTPRESMRSFRDMTDRSDFEAAAHILNLADLTPAEQRERGAELARQLSEIFQRGESIQISRLSGRQDAAIEDPTGENPNAGEPRRDIELASLEANGDAYDIRLGRYRVGEEEPIWLIMPESVAAIPALYREYGPTAFERHIPDSLKKPFGLLRVWEWIAIPLVLLVVGLLGKGVYRLIEVMTRWLPTGSPSIFATQIRGPVAFIVMSLLTQALLDYVVSFSAVATTTLRVVLIAILAWGTGAVALRLVDTIMLKMTRRLAGQIDDSKPKDDRKLLTTLYAVRRIIILIMVTAVTIYVLGQIQLFETLGLSILASASVLAVLVGVAGQAVLGNILSSFQLSLAKPIRVGDLVMFEGQWCYVEGIFYTHIRLRIWNERRLIVPVTYFASKAFENLSAKSTKEYRSVVLTLHLSADISLLREKFIEFAKAEDNVIEHHKLLCAVTDQTGPAQTVTCYLMTVDPLSGWAAEVSVREKLLTFIRDNHPEWWPREVVVISHRDVARGHATGDDGETSQ